MNETLEDSSPWEKLQRLDFFLSSKNAFRSLSAWLCLLALAPLMMQKKRKKKERKNGKKSVSNGREERELWTTRTEET